MTVRDDQLHPAQATSGKLARGKAVQKVSASEAPISMPSTSVSDVYRERQALTYRPSLLTPTATITATEMMRPFWRIFT
jgi:hypothetical protein